METEEKAAKGGNTSSLPESFQQLGATERPLGVRKRMFGRAWPMRAPVRDGIVPLWPQIAEKIAVPCVVSYIFFFSFFFYTLLVVLGN
jgi:serine carboxypeptidase-like clade 1